MQDVVVQRLDFGYFVRPAEETDHHQPRVEPCLGYLVRHRHATLLFDTGMGSHPEVDEQAGPDPGSYGRPPVDGGRASVYFAHDHAVWTP